MQVVPNNALNYRSLRSLDSQKLRFCLPVSLTVREYMSTSASVTLKNIKTELFNKIAENLIERGWVKVAQYDGLDAWIDYGRLIIEKDGVQIDFEWNNWEEGEISSDVHTISSLRNEYGLP